MCVEYQYKADDSLIPILIRASRQLLLFIQYSKQKAHVIRENLPDTMQR